MTGGKTLPTFLQSSPYLQNPTRDGIALTKSESQEAVNNQGRQSTKFTDVVALITSNKTKFSNDTNTEKTNPVQESRSSSILEEVKANGYSNQESPISQDREGVIQQQPRNISTAASMKSNFTSSPGSMDCHPLSSRYNYSSQSTGVSSSTTISSMTDRQKRLLTRTILHPDEIDLIINSFKRISSECTSMRPFVIQERRDDVPSAKNENVNLNDDDELSVSSIDVKAWLQEL